VITDLTNHILMLMTAPSPLLGPAQQQCWS